MIRSIVDGMLLAFSYFTVLPTFKHNLKIDNLTYISMLFFTPLCGMILAILSIYFAFGLNMLFSPLYAIVLASIFYLCSYGFLHLEAVADVIDAWMAKYSNKDIYEIMKEPQVGSIGAVGTFCFVLLKLAALIYLFINESYFIIVMVLILSRLSIIYNVHWFSFHQASSFANTLKHNSSWKLILFSLLVYALIGIYLIEIEHFLILLFSSVIISSLVLKVLQKRFGFLNGDCMGCSIEVTELILLNIGLLL